MAQLLSKQVWITDISWTRNKKVKISNKSINILLLDGKLFENVYFFKNEFSGNSYEHRKVSLESRHNTYRIQLIFQRNLFEHAFTGQGKANYLGLRSYERFANPGMAANDASLDFQPIAMPGEQNFHKEPKCLGKDLASSISENMTYSCKATFTKVGVDFRPTAKQNESNSHKRLNCKIIYV